MLRKAINTYFAFTLFAILAVLAGNSTLAFEPPASVDVSDLKITGRITGTAFAFDMGMNVTTQKANDALPLVKGDVVLEQVTAPAANRTLSLDAETRTYAMTFAQPGARQVTATFAARAKVVQSDWRESTFALPAARIRSIELICDRADLEVQLPGALRVQRVVADKKLTITALLAPNQPFTVRWKPQVQKLEGKLVMASEANTVATVSVGALRLDNLFEFTISQGKLDALTFSVPRALSVTQVKGASIQDWSINKPEGDAPATLTVQLNRSQTQRYGLQILSEMVLKPFPTEIAIPVIAPQGGLRAGGNLSIGTNSAIQLVVRDTAGLTQINGSAFPRVVLDRKSPRPLPSNKAFYFTHATTPYGLNISMDHIVPSYEATQLIRINTSEDDLTIEGALQLDIRDAPIRHFEFAVPVGFVVADVSGQQVAEGSPRDPVAGQTTRIIDVHLKQPILGNLVVNFKLELGRGPLDAAHTVQGFGVKGATLKRSFLVIAADQGVYIDAPQSTNMRTMNTAAVPIRVNNAQYAYSYRQSDWSLQFTPRKKPAGLRAESFHLITLGDGVLYGNIAVNYFITGSPVDTFTFRIPANMGNVQFVGQDLRPARRDADDPELVTVKLSRKVIGDYNLSLIYTNPYKNGEQIEIGSIRPSGDEIQTQSGHVVVASHLHLDITAKDTPNTLLMPISPDEVPNVNLLVTAPVLKAYKFAKPPHNQILQVRAFDRADLLPAIIEVTDIRTEVFIDKDKATQSRTIVRYKVKNWSRQFLPLVMPEGVQTWQARSGVAVYQNDRFVDQLEPAKASRNGNILLVPLPRRQNPNTPITVEVEYGREHDSHDRIELVAPSTDPKHNVESTFTSWVIHAPDEWAVKVAGTSTDLLPSPRPQTHGSIAVPLQQAVSTWTGSFGYFGETLSWFGDFFDTHVGWPFAVVFAAAFAVFVTVNVKSEVRGPKVLMGVILLVMLALWFWNQLGATEDRSTYLLAWTWAVVSLVIASIMVSIAVGRRAVSILVPIFMIAFLFAISLLGFLGHTSEDLNAPIDDWSSVHLTQTVTLNASDHLVVNAQVMPAWQQNSTAWGTISLLVAIACMAGVLIGCFREESKKLRSAWRPLAVIGSLALLIFLGQYQPMESFIVALLTWVIPLCLLIFILGRSINPILKATPARVVAAASVTIMLLAGTNQASAQDGVLAIAPKEPVFEHVNAKLTADTDSVAVDLTLKVTAAEPVRHLLMNQTPILLTPDKPDAPVRVQRQGGKYYLQITKAGTHTVALRFLSPLPDANADRARRFQFPLPTALTNRVNISIPETGLDVVVHNAMKITKGEKNQSTAIAAILGAGDDINVQWQPRARETSKEDTSFFAQVTSAIRFDTSLVEARHLLQFQIAQGELKNIRVKVPQPMTVTAVQGASLGAWRFDPATNELDIRLSQAFTGEYSLQIVTQISQKELPYNAAVGTLVVRDAVRQRGILGLMSTSAVNITIQDSPQAMNTDDFSRQAAAALKTFPGYAAGSIRHAYRTVNEDDAVAVQVSQVKPEIRADEQVTYSISDERLVYNGTVQIQITKAGVFNAELKMPANYDIDTLVAPQISHWDESVADGIRTITVHFKQKHMGTVPLRLELSQSVTELPKQIDVPRVEVTQALKHTGHVVITADRGVRMAVANRDGVSELNPLALNVRQQGALAFKLLKPDWSLNLTTEVIEPRITVEFLHVAKVTDALVRHTHYLRYRLHNAGTKVFEITVPKDALSLLIKGPDIARRQETEAGSGRYRVELNSKWYDDRGEFPLEVTYETKLNMPVTTSEASTAQANLHLKSVLAEGADFQRGHVAVFTTERVHLTRDQDSKLQTAEPRRIPRVFNAGDLSSAAFCFSSTTPNYDILLSATRHGAAALLEADARSTRIDSVVTDNGNSVNRVQMQLRVGNKQHLKAKLPAGSKIWSLLVNGKATVPSHEPSKTGEPTLLIPLGAAAKQGSEVFIEFVYVHPKPADWSPTQPHFAGPQFDLPLKDVTWRLYVPDQYDYDDFEGSMSVNDGSLKNEKVLSYYVNDYDARVFNTNRTNLNIAKEAQQAGEYWANQGDRGRGQQALESALHYSAFSEDARVKLHQFNNDNVLIALDNNRKRLRATADAGKAAGGVSTVENFDPNYVQRVRSSLSKADSENLEMQAKVWTRIQEEAAGETVQLIVQMPYRGRVIEFTRSVQVQENADMNVKFSASHKDAAEAGSFWWLVGLLVALSLCFWCCPKVCAMWGCFADGAMADRPDENGEADANDDSAE